MAKDGTGRCARCETLPAGPATGWTVYVWPPQGHSGGKIERALAAAGLELDRGPDGRALQLALNGPAARAAVQALVSQLSAEELADTRTLALAEGQTPGFADYPKVGSLDRLIHFLRADPLLDTLREGAIAVEFRPIAYADDPDDLLGHQAHLRFPRMEQPAPAVVDLAEKADLLHQLDRACRMACIERAAADGLGTPIFVEFHPAAIYDPVYCLRTTVATANRVGIAPENIVFTLNRAAREHDVGHLQHILDYYRTRGFRVALGQLGSGLGSLELLQNLRPEFAWLHADLVAGVDGDPYRAVITRKLLEMAHRLRIETIGDGGLHRADREWLYEHGVDYLVNDGTADTERRATPAPGASVAAQ